MSVVATQSISVWGLSIPITWLSPVESAYLGGLPPKLPTVEWVWDEMDRVWRECGLNNRCALSEQPVGDFYSHPVWLMNGIFTATDPVSVSHRYAIARYLNESGVRSIADFGGGFGEFALALSRLNPGVSVDIVEPYPSRVTLERFANAGNIRVVPDLDRDGYDVVLAQDVLEHVEDPVKLADLIASAVRKNGLVIFANCFYPVIQCHLPATFHLRHTFRFVMKALGLRYVGVVNGAAHAQVFMRTGSLDLAKARRVESLSRVAGPAANLSRMLLSRLKGLVISR